MPLFWRCKPVKSGGRSSGHSWSTSSPFSRVLFPNIALPKHLWVSGASYSKALSQNHDCSYALWETLLWTLVFTACEVSGDAVCQDGKGPKGCWARAQLCSVNQRVRDRHGLRGLRGEATQTQKRWANSSDLKAFADILSSPKMIFEN